MYEFWSDVSKFPLWQEHVVSVTTTVSEKVSHWVMGNPEGADGKRLEFDSEIVGRCAREQACLEVVSAAMWSRSGEVYFAERHDGRGSVVTLIQHFKVGALASAAAGVAKRSPKQTVIEDLRHFKELVRGG